MKFRKDSYPPEEVALLGCPNICVAGLAPPEYAVVVLCGSVTTLDAGTPSGTCYP